MVVILHVTYMAGNATAKMYAASGLVTAGWIAEARQNARDLT